MAQTDTETKPTPFYERSPFIAAAGALAVAVMGAIGYFMQWPPEAYAVVAPVVGAMLALWKSGVSLPPGRRGVIDLTVLRLLASASALVIFAMFLFGFVH